MKLFRSRKTDNAALERFGELCDRIASYTDEVAFQTESERLNLIKRLRTDYAFFVEHCFPHYAKTKCGWFHIKAANKILQGKYIRLLLMWARAHAKSTHANVFIPLWLKIQEPRELNFMVLCGKSEDSANTLLSDVQAELSSNKRYIAYFGEQIRAGSWERGRFITNDGCMFMAIGRGQSPRGMRYRQYRPDYIVMDDCDDDELSRNEKRVDQTYDWALEALLMASDMGKCRFIIANNKIAKNSLVARFEENSKFEVLQVNALDENGNPNWPEKYTKRDIEMIIEDIGYRRAQKELFNNPIVGGTVFSNMVFGKVPKLEEFKYLVVYGDPAPSNKENAKNSSKACWLMGQKDNKFYVIFGFVGNIKNSTFVEWYFVNNQFVGGKSVVKNYIENNSLQDPFYEQVYKPLFDEMRKAKGMHLYPIPDSRKKPDKYIRIEALEPVHQQGRLIFNEEEKNNNHMKLLIEQFESFENTLSTDCGGPDAVEGGIYLLMTTGEDGRSKFRSGNYKKSKTRSL